MGQKDPPKRTQTPKVQDLLTNSIEIDFTSDSVHEATGFRVEWESVKGECGGRVNATGQGTTLIATPGYPQGYPPGLNCTWYIDTSVDQVMRLEFSSDFEVGTKTGTDSDCGRSDAFVTASLDNQFLEYEFTADNLGEFTAYQIKIVMSGTNQAYPVRIKELRTIALK